MNVIFAARIFATFMFGAILFQIALAIGKPWGEFAWGGHYPGTLPGFMRFASLVQAFFLLVLVIIVLIRAGIFHPAWQSNSRKFVWIVVAYCGLGVIANAITPSLWERVIWLPVLAVSFVSSFVVAKSR